MLLKSSNNASTSLTLTAIAKQQAQVRSGNMSIRKKAGQHPARTHESGCGSVAVHGRADEYHIKAHTYYTHYEIQYGAYGKVKHKGYMYRSDYLFASQSRVRTRELRTGKR
jgi:hypothetical protein